QLSIVPGDRDFLRFLWCSNPFDKPYCLQEYKMARVPFGTKASPFLLKASVLYHVEKYADKHPVEVSILKRQLYVDDLLARADNSEDVISRSLVLKQILGDAKMDLTKWRSNSNKVESALAPTSSNTTCEKTVKVLGLIWNVETDTLSVDVNFTI